MIDREDLPFIKNVLELHNDNLETSFLYNILSAVRDNKHLQKDIFDSFSNNQFKSKIALLDAIDNLHILNKNSTVVIWGGWYGSILIPKLANKVKKIISIDLDNEPLQIAKNRLFSNYTNIDYICENVFKSYKKSYIDANLIINTSCEHMPSMREWPWFDAGAIEGDNDTTVYRTPKLSNNCYFAFQSNNMFGIEGHVNCVNSIEEFKDQLPERAVVLYQDEVEDTRGTRYMLVGKLVPI